MKAAERMTQPGGFLVQLDDVLQLKSARLAEKLQAWAELLDAVGWCVALTPPGASLWLSEGATRDLQSRGKLPVNSAELMGILNQLPLTARHLECDGVQIWASSQTEAPSPLSTAKLTIRETEVLNWLRHGKTSPEISIILGCSTRTVETHVNNLYRKLGVKGRSKIILHHPKPRD